MNFPKMEIATQKKEIIAWILSIDDQEILNKIEILKPRKKFDFEEELKKGISGEELKNRTTAFLKTIPWKI